MAENDKVVEGQGKWGRVWGHTGKIPFRHLLRIKDILEDVDLEGPEEEQALAHVRRTIEMMVLKVKVVDSRGRGRR